ncbi:MAG: hypothetical protein QM486_08080 [Flavobacteriaceae bacterium]
MSAYYFYTRFSPIFLVLLPIYLLSIPFCVDVENTIKCLSIILILTGLVSFISNLDKNFGKKKEKELWKIWQGAPVEILLNDNTNYIDLKTKDNYHSKLLKILPRSREIDLKTISNEEKSHIYQWLVMYLIKQRFSKIDSTELNNKNMVYGFKRHLWGLRKFGITFLIISIIGYFVYRLKVNNFDLSTLHLSFYLQELILIILLFGWVYFINNSWVKKSAMDYTKLLLSHLDQI